MKWLPITEFPDYYLVSEFGEIKRIDSGHILSPKRDKDGYLYLGLRINTKRYWRRISRLVALSFIPNPDNKPLVNHKDLNVRNNHISNLEWVTLSENMKHAIANGVKMGTMLSKPFLGKTGGLSPFSKKIIQMDLEGNEIKVWDARVDAQRAGFSSAIKVALKDQSKTSGGYKWKYA